MKGAVAVMVPAAGQIIRTYIYHLRITRHLVGIRNHIHVRIRKDRAFHHTAPPQCFHTAACVSCYCCTAPVWNSFEMQNNEAAAAAVARQGLLQEYSTVYGHTVYSCTYIYCIYSISKRIATTHRMETYQNCFPLHCPVSFNFTFSLHCYSLQEWYSP